MDSLYKMIYVLYLVLDKYNIARNIIAAPKIQRKIGGKSRGLKILTNILYLF
jgi:hypothetical protein